MAFTDEKFDDNSHWNGTGSDPVFSLAVIQPDFTALTACSSKVSPNVYDVTFSFHNNNGYTWTNVSATCLLTGGVTASNTAGPGTVVANSTTSFTVRITIDPTLNRKINATLNLTDNYGMNVNLIYNLYPIVVITNTTVSLPICAGYTKQVAYQAKVLGIAMDNLVATVSSPDVSNFARTSDCTTLNSQTLGATTCTAFGVFGGTGSPSQIQLANPLGTTAAITIAWTDGALTFASSLIHLTGL